MRKAIYRFWDSFNGEMVYSKDFKKFSNFFIVYESALELGNKPELMQYAFDLDGREIYEGDILSSKTFDDLWVVTWRELGFGLQNVQDPTRWIVGDQFHYIGDKFRNYELLKHE